MKTFLNIVDWVGIICGVYVVGKLGFMFLTGKAGKGGRKAARRRR